jgi:hypothetical protein
VDSSLLLKVVETFQQIVIDNPEFNTQKEHQFIFEFLTALSNSQGFNFSIDFLTNDEKAQIKKLVDAIEVEESKEAMIKAYCP